MRLRHVHNFALLFAAALTGCGGGGGGTTTLPNPPSAAGTTMSVTFTGTSQPTAVAVAIGTGAFAHQTLAGGHLSFTLPTGTSTFQLAYHCPLVTLFGQADYEYVIDANKSDGTALSLACYGGTVATSSVSVTADATAIASATNIAVRGSLGYGGAISSPSGTASMTFDNGSNDIAALALTSTNAIAAVKIIRAQAIPGTLSPITFAATDATTTATMTVAGIVAGFSVTPAYNISYQTVNGTNFELNASGVPTFAVVPVADTAAGDAYAFETNDVDLATNQHIGASVFTGIGGPITVTLPTPWTYTGPTAAQYPTFTFAYSGFSGSPVVTYSGVIGWSENPTTEAGIYVYATPAYLAGATTVSVPNLSALTGFLASPASGTAVSVTSEIDGASALTYLQIPQSTGNEYYVQNDSTYNEP
jgi:hypothetical protein